ncbi:MAG: superoxide dismutase [Lysobacteraceae bacterium]|jgi:Fe-Mn family superoxide dismutase|nr:superoxide dismutase [Xanthomonadaceae bacterium]MCZ8317984.1 superoxide dismutase [Silanimonas sp.]
MRLAPIALALSFAIVLPVSAQAPAAPATAAAPVAQGPYVLPPLPYVADALEPAIDAETMTIHHQRHHGAQVNALNQLSATVPELKDGTIEPVLARVSTLPAGVRNNLGGHYNHSLFWSVMAPAGQGGAPSAELAAAITAAFGSMDAMKQQFSQAAATRFGSGWAWLIVKADGTLAITSTPNQDNPLMDVAEVRGTPVLGLDVWEHAYYLKYRNLRGDYIAAWWDVVNWNEVSRRHAEAVAGSR